jgi:putative aminopeptidase FrvX
MTEIEFNIGKEDLEWIKKYLRNASPSGNEINGQKIWLDYIKPHVDDHIIDAYGNVAAVINPTSKFKVVLEAHADEVAWYVHTITQDGFLHVEKNGGADPGIAPSQHVRINTENGVIPGIFGWPAIHTRKASSSHKVPAPETIFIDCGCSSRKQVMALGIQIGDCVTYETGLRIMNHDWLVGRGQDNKMGGFMIATVARLLRENDVQLPFGLYMVNSVQEEVGLHGAGLMANKIKPNCAFVTDVTHATHTPLMDKNKHGDIQSSLGPVITKAPSVHNKLRELLVNTAQHKGIPYQLTVSSKKTGTDADAFAYAGAGIPSALVALPLRYMHTTVETTHKSDVENAVKLLYNVICSITPDFNFNYF